MVTDVLQDAIDRGSGVAVRASGFSSPAAGKTGTTNDATDAWFVGYTPSVLAAVWVGHDQPRSLGAQASGGRVAAPVWGRVMARTNIAHGGKWKKPDGVVERWIDAATGSALKEGCRSLSGSGYREVFLRGRMPGESCPQRGDMFAAQREIPAAAEEEALLEEWPAEIAGQSEPAPPPEYEEAERASRVTEENEEEEEEEEKEQEEQQQQQKKEDPEKAEQQKKAAESVIIPQKTEPAKPATPPASGNQSPKIPGDRR
jgi:penicillin-binding protein 1A